MLRMTPGRATVCSWLLTVALIVLLAALCVPAAQASFGVEEQNFEADTCNDSGCTYASSQANKAETFTRAAGHPPYGITSFELNHKKGLLGEEPEGSLKRIRVDLPPGLAGNPEALPGCEPEAFDKGRCQADTKVGEVEMTIYDGVNLTIPGTVYNLKQPPGLPLDFGIEIAVEPLVKVRIFLEGHVAWWSDYHEYFEIDEIPREGKVLGVAVPLAVLKSKLIFNGRAGNGNFLTLSSVCSSSTTSYLEVESWEKEVSKTQTHTPVGVEGCQRVPFSPSAELRPETSQSDQPDGAVAEVRVPQNSDPEALNTSDIKDVHVLLPEGLTLNPPAASGLQACDAAQIGIGSPAPVTCPAAAKLGTVTIETDLPPGSLSGTMYLGSPIGATITGPPYTIYLDAESVYGVSVRLQGTVNPNPVTGRLEVTFANNPQLPFSDVILKLDGGPHAALANPLVCGNAPVQALFTPYTGVPSSFEQTPQPFTTTGCPSPLPFALTQATQASNSATAAFTSYTFDLARSGGQQYLSQLRTVLPEGLVGRIPSVPRCREPQAAEGTCPASSEIGTASVSIGAGPEPMGLSGPVFLTGPYAGAPYGLSVDVPAKIGVFDLGSGACDCVVTRAAIGVDPYSGRVIATSALPTVIKGVPLRLRSLSVVVDRPKFLFNPTDCAVLSTETTLTSAFASTQMLTSPFQATGCSALPFKPKLTASTKAKTSRALGAALKTKITVPSGVQANIRSVLVSLPKQLPARTSTLNQACREATFDANPFSCPPGAHVGTASVATPVLPEPLQGSAILVSHGGRAFPDLDLLLSGDGGVTVILVGHTNIVKNITSSEFASLPDVPVSSVEVKLPQGRKSALGANGNLCAKPLFMPTVITGQNGKALGQRIRIAVAGCPRKHRHARHRGGRRHPLVHKASR